MKERKNVYKLPPGDSTFQWYAKAIISMKSRPTKDPRSWNYQAGMHNFDSASSFWRGAAPLPGPSERREFWDQCQHGSWFFLPWHRMYLAYFEQIVGETIVELGGPPDWALPFWDYSDQTDPKVLTIPPAFTNPGDASNGLWITGRRSHTLDVLDVETDRALKPIPFSGIGSAAFPSFGGGERTPDNHGGQRGQLENLPHGSVHVTIGGAMGNPDTAGLDPIFWLHHANIDRLWQVWLNQGHNRINPTKSSWLDTDFSFHDKDGTIVEMKCSEVVDTRKVLTGYTYEGVAADLPVPIDPSPGFGLIKKIDFSMPLEVVAATNKKLSLSSEKTKVSLKLTPPPKKKANLSFIKEAIDKPQTAILNFENITGKGTPPTQRIYLNVPDDEGNKQAYYAGSISLFGVEAASKPSLHHSGSGQHQSLDVSELINKLRSLPNWNEKQLDITIEPARQMDNDASVKIGRISLYSE